MSAPERATGPLQREIRLLFGALIAFLIVLIVALLTLTVSILRLNGRASTADSVTAAIRPAMTTASAEDLTARLQHLGSASGVSRIEVYRGTQLYAASGAALPTAEVLTRRTADGRVLLYFEMWSWAGGRRTALITAAYVLLAAMTGVLIFILYVRQFLRPVEEMLDHARLLNENARGDHDARYLVHTFREAVERIQQQSREIDDLKDAASSRPRDVLELARALNTSFKSGFIALDAHGSVIAINDVGRQILKLPESGPVESLHQLPESFATPIRNSIESKTALTRREILLAPETLVGLTTVPLFDDANFVGLFALFTDLTTFRAMEGRLRDLEALLGLGQMAAGIAHEVRNSLFTILGYLKLAGRNAPEDVAVKIRAAEEEGKNLAGVVDSLLSFTKPLQIRSQTVALEEVAASVIERVTAVNGDVRIVSALEHAGVSGDRDLLERAIENIVRNAIDAVRERHSDGGGLVEVKTTATPQPTIEIRDNGIGIDPEKIASYLLPFQSGKAHGVGLGLPLARKIILHHGATLTIEGKPGEGTLVRIAFFTPVSG